MVRQKRQVLRCSLPSGPNSQIWHQMEQAALCVYSVETGGACSQQKWTELTSSVCLRGVVTWMCCLSTPNIKLWLYWVEGTSLSGKLGQMVPRGRFNFLCFTCYGHGRTLYSMNYLKRGETSGKLMLVTNHSDTFVFYHKMDAVKHHHWI